MKKLRILKTGLSNDWFIPLRPKVYRSEQIEVESERRNKNSPIEAKEMNLVDEMGEKLN